MAHLIIDGYNIQALWEIKQNREGRDAFIDWLDRHLKHFSKSVLVVFDGGRFLGIRSESRKGNLEIIFSEAGQSADQVIENLCQYYKDQAWIVTEDKALRRACLAAGSQWVPLSVFWSIPGQLPQSSGTKQGEDDAFLMAIMEKGDGLPRSRTRSTKKKGSAKKHDQSTRKAQRFWKSP
jgi:hypothetical protein